MIFVFGSNLAGIHGRGAARHAMKHYGAVWGKGIGHFGNSYAIPTKDENIKTLPLERIKEYVDDFVLWARNHPRMKFYLTRVGRGVFVTLILWWICSDRKSKDKYKENN